MAKMSPGKIISCPFKCEDKTDCSKGLPKKSFVLLEVIGKGPYRQKLSMWYAQNKEFRDKAVSNRSLGMKIFVNTLDGKKVTMWVNPQTATVGSL